MLLALFGLGVSELIIVGLCVAVPLAIVSITVAVVLLASPRREQ